MLVDNVRLLIEWAPLAGYSRRLSAATDDAGKAEVIAEAVEWLASKTGNRMDDALARHVAAVLKTPEGAALAGWITDKAAELEETP